MKADHTSLRFLYLTRLLTGSFFCFLLIALFFPTDAFCMTDGDFKDEVSKAEKLITGGYFRLSLMVMCAFGGIVCILEKKLTGALVCAAATLFVYMMKGWITSNFAAVI